MTYGQMVLDNNKRLEDLEEWRAELRGAFGLIKFALGASIASGVVSILAMAQILGGK